MGRHTKICAGTCSLPKIDPSCHIEGNMPLWTFREDPQMGYHSRFSITKARHSRSGGLEKGRENASLRASHERHRLPALLSRLAWHQSSTSDADGGKISIPGIVPHPTFLSAPDTKSLWESFWRTWGFQKRVADLLRQVRRRVGRVALSDVGWP